MKILIVRNMAQQINLNTYNNQELGLAKSLTRKGHQCDIVFYSKTNGNKIERYTEDDITINIYWMKGLNIYYNAIFLKLLFYGQLNSYDIIQTHEYNQLMTFLLPYFTKKKLIIFHGPYKNISKKFIHKLFDFFFLKKIVKNYPIAIAKSDLAKNYLLEKGFREVEVAGVGLDYKNFIETIPYEKSILNNYTKELNGNLKLLYIGRLDDNKNIIFLFDIVFEISKRNKNVKLILVGDGLPKDKQKYFDYMKELGIEEHIIYIEKIEQTEVKYFYECADIFLLPSIIEIYGMVILEALYFNCPVITTLNGGSSTILKDTYPEMIIKELDVVSWANRISEIVSSEYKTSEYIKNYFSWDSLSNKFLKTYMQLINGDQI